MLPSEPKIFHGRDTELLAIVNSLKREAPRIVILGAAGMGKTSLAQVVLHHPEVTARYEQHCFFVACDSVSTSVELAGLVGSHLGIKAGKDLTRPVIQHLSSGEPYLLILDNLETSWEPMESRRSIEEFLSFLAGVQDLALIVGAELFPWRQLISFD